MGSYVIGHNLMYKKRFPKTRSTSLATNGQEEILKRIFTIEIDRPKGETLI